MYGEQQEKSEHDVVGERGIEGGKEASKLRKPSRGRVGVCTERRSLAMASSFLILHLV